MSNVDPPGGIALGGPAPGPEYGPPAARLAEAEKRANHNWALLMEALREIGGADRVIAGLTEGAYTWACSCGASHVRTGSDSLMEFPVRVAARQHALEIHPGAAVVVRSTHRPRRDWRTPAELAAVQEATEAIERGRKAQIMADARRRLQRRYRGR
jgi:hypothetical protein